MSAEVLAAARSTLRDLDAALAAQEAAAAVAWLDAMFVEACAWLATHDCGMACCPPMGERHAELRAYARTVSAGGTQRAMVAQLPQPGSIGVENGDDLWPERPGVDSAEWPRPHPEDDLRTPEEQWHDELPPRSPLSALLHDVLVPAAHAAVREAAELAEAMVRLRAVLPREALSDGQLERLRTELAAIAEPWRADTLRALLQLIYDGEEIAWDVASRAPAGYLAVRSVLGAEAANTMTLPLIAPGEPT